MTPEKKRIVCGTDFSIHAADAATLAALLADRLKESLVVIHAVQDNDSAGDMSAAKEKLHHEAERLRKLGPTVVREELVNGSASGRLVESGDQHSTRLLVISSLGQIAPGRFLLGSVAERTAEHSAAPTLVVRGSTALKAWARGESSLKIVVGYDFSASADAALGWINELRGIGPCDVTAVHVVWLPGEFKRFGLTESGSLLEIGHEMQGLLERDLKAKVTAVLGENNVHIRVVGSWGKPDLPLIEAARDANADLIVVGTHQREGLSRFRLGSVSRSVLRHSPITVAVVPPPKPGTLAPGPLPHFGCVLVPTDFSDAANRAIPYAYSALARGGKVCLLHVISPAEDTPERRAGPDLRKHHLRGLIPAEAGARGIETVAEMVTHTEPATAICQAAERIGADLICLGSHDRSGIARTLLGSVAEKVMAQSTRPLLILRPQTP